MDITTDRSHPVDGKVKVRQVPIRPLQERHQEASKTTINVKANLVLFG